MSTPDPHSKRDVLYSPRQIYVASFLGTPAAAAWFMALNHRALAEPHKERQILTFGGIATIAVVVVAFLLPERTPNVLWPIVYSVAIYLFAQSRFGATVERHLADGGHRGSWWRVVWVSLLFCLGVLAVFFVIILVFPDLVP